MQRLTLLSKFLGLATEASVKRFRSALVFTHQSIWGDRVIGFMNKVNCSLYTLSLTIIFNFCCFIASMAYNNWFSKRRSRFLNLIFAFYEPFQWRQQPEKVLSRIVWHFSTVTLYVLYSVHTARLAVAVGHIQQAVGTYVSNFTGIGPNLAV